MTFHHPTDGGYPGTAPGPAAPPYAPAPYAGTAYTGPYTGGPYAAAPGSFPLPPASQRSNRILLWVVGTIGAIAIVCTMLVYVAPVVLLSKAMDEFGAMSDEATEEILNESLDVEIGRPRPIPGPGTLRSVELPVALHNKGDRRASFLVTIEATTESGERLDTVLVSAPDVAPNQTVRQTETLHASGQEYKALLAAKYTVINVSMY